MDGSNVIDQIRNDSTAQSSSHDSGAYELISKFGFANDRPDLQQNWWLNAFKLITYPIIEHFSITQNMNIYQQLYSGIRYLDIRIAQRTEDQCFYICHNFYGPPLEKVLNDIGQFAQSNHSEIIIIDIQHLHNVKTHEDHVRLLNLFQNKLGSNMIKNIYDSNDLMSITLRTLWTTKRQIIVFYRNPYQRVASQHYWPSEQLCNPWPNTTEPRMMKQFLIEKIKTRPLGKFFVSQGVLTPNTFYVIRNCFGTLYNRLANKANHCLYELIVIVDNYNGNIFQVSTPDNLMVSCSNRPNIIMFDFVDWESNLLIKRIIDLNHRNERYFHVRTNLPVLDFVIGPICCPDCTFRSLRFFVDDVDALFSLIDAILVLIITLVFYKTMGRIASIVLTTLSLFLGMFFFFMGVIKLSPALNVDIHREIRRRFVRYARVIPFLTVPFGIKISARTYRQTIGIIEIVAGLALAFLPDRIKLYMNLFLFSITFGAIYTHIAIEDEVDKMYPAIAFTIILICRLILYVLQCKQRKSEYDRQQQQTEEQFDEKQCKLIHQQQMDNSNEQQQRQRQQKQQQKKLNRKGRKPKLINKTIDEDYYVDVYNNSDESGNEMKKNKKSKKKRSSRKKPTNSIKVD
ncbi:PI-PLC X domain-containing protein 2, partial [Blomia tropicalis]